MNDEMWLSPTDVAEALGCSVQDVLESITSGSLRARHQHGWWVAHSDLAGFIAEHQRTAIELGFTPVFLPEFAVSRPVNDDSDDRH